MIKKTGAIITAKTAPTWWDHDKQSYGTSFHCADKRSRFQLTYFVAKFQVLLENFSDALNEKLAVSYSSYGYGNAVSKRQSPRNGIS